jgi:hypothetical protein
MGTDMIAVVGLEGEPALEIQPVTTRRHRVVDYHLIHPFVKRIIRLAEEHSRERRHVRRKAFRRTLRPRDTTATLMLGAASAGLAVVMLIVTILGACGIAFPPWTVPRQVMVEATLPPSTVVSGSAPVTAKRVPLLVPSGRVVFVPSGDCHWLLLLGALLGGIGLAASLRRREFSWLSAIGFLLMLLMMEFVVACDMLMTLAP